MNLNVSEEYIPLVNDLIKFSVIFIVVNVLMFIIDTNNKLFSEKYFQLMILTLLGLATYWLVVKNLLVLKSDQV